MTKKYTLNDIIELQSSFDEAHGFKIIFEKTDEKYQQISYDLIGLLGEIGEIANIVKKINLKLNYSKNIDIVSLHNSERLLKEEIVDSLVYLIRLSKLLNVDIESEYIKKLDKNRLKYGDYHG